MNHNWKETGKKFAIRFGAVLLFGTLFWTISKGTARGIPNYAALFKGKYGYLPSCQICHVEGAWENTEYGQDFKAAGHSLRAFEAIEPKDSDGDGVANYLEIVAKSNPGDPLSRPERPGPWLDGAEIHAPVKLMKSAFPQAGSFTVWLPSLDLDRAESLSKRVGEPLPDESRFCVVFSARGMAGVLGYGSYVSFELPGHAGDLNVLFMGVDSDGRLQYLKFLKYAGNSQLAKEDAWKGMLGKTSGQILASDDKAGSDPEMKTVTNNIARGMMVIESFAPRWGALGVVGDRRKPNVNKVP